LRTFTTFGLWFIEGAFVGSSATYALDQWGKGQSVGIFQSLAKAWYHVPDLLAAATIALAIIAGLTITIIGIPWAVARYVRWAFTTQSIMIDGQEGEPSLAHSASLVEGEGWSTFWRLLAVELTVQLPLALAATTYSYFVGGLPGGLPGVFLGALAFPFKTATRTLLYYDLKMRKALA
jgi:hypothetical protein